MYVMSIPYPYSYTDLRSDLYIAAKNIFTLRLRDGFDKLKETSAKVNEKIIANFKEYVLDKYREKCHLYPKECAFHADGNPYLRNFYDNRPQPSFKWTLARVVEYKCRDSVDYFRRHPVITLIALLAITTVGIQHPIYSIGVMASSIICILPATTLDWKSSGKVI